MTMTCPRTWVNFNIFHSRLLGTVTVRQYLPNQCYRQFTIVHLHWKQDSDFEFSLCFQLFPRSARNLCWFSSTPMLKGLVSCQPRHVLCCLPIGSDPWCTWNLLRSFSASFRVSQLLVRSASCWKCVDNTLWNLW